MENQKISKKEGQLKHRQTDKADIKQVLHQIKCKKREFFKINQINKKL